MTLRLVVASTNPGKIREIAAILTDADLLPRPDGIPDIEETGETLVENALLKARVIASVTGCAAVADDTGLFVDGLGGAPGVRSARYAGEHATDAENVTKILTDLDPGSPRIARFETAAVAAWPDGRELVAIGTAPGTITVDRRGSGGFGYDVIFVPDEGDGRTFAEMTPTEKDAISHRGRAFRKLAQQLR